MKYTILLFFASALLQAQTITQVPIPSGSTAGNVCAGSPVPNQEWFVAENEIGWIDTSLEAIGGEIRVPAPTGGSVTTGLVGCDFGIDGKLYFANQKTATLYAYDPISLTFTWQSIPAPNSGVAGLVWNKNGDGKLYIMIPPANAIQIWNPTTSTWDAALSTGGNFPHGPTACPDDNVWFALTFSGQFGYVTPSRGKVLFSVPQGTGSNPFDVACSIEDNNAYVTEMNGNVIAWVDRGALPPSYTIHYKALPSSTPKGMTINNGFVYIACSATNQLCVMPLGGGDVHRYDVPITNTQPNKVNIGPDGNVWFSEHNYAAMAVFH
jgi:streptogramin lyase